MLWDFDLINVIFDIVLLDEHSRILFPITMLLYIVCSAKLGLIVKMTHI